MADADAMLIKKLNVTAWKAATPTRIWESIRDAASDLFRYPAEKMATGILSGVSPAAHSLAAIRRAASWLGSTSAMA
jgi:hypothetical protein